MSKDSRTVVNTLVQYLSDAQLISTPLCMSDIHIRFTQIQIQSWWVLNVVIHTEVP